jgi:hypothetical protein
MKLCQNQLNQNPAVLHPATRPNHLLCGVKRSNRAEKLSCSMCEDTLVRSYNMYVITRSLHGNREPIPAAASATAARVHIQFTHFDGAGDSVCQAALHRGRKEEEVAQAHEDIQRDGNSRPLWHLQPGMHRS